MFIMKTIQRPGASTSILFLLFIGLSAASCENKDNKTVSITDRSGNLVIRLNCSEDFILDMNHNIEKKDKTRYLI